MLLCRKFPTATRIRPSRGDAGIDVLVPLEHGHAVYQVKRFSANLTTGQKTQIVDSYERLAASELVRALDVREWHLVMPLDPTKENLLWFRGLGADASYSQAWDGLTFCDALAAEYPTVVDYYLHDGRDRLETALSSMTDILRLEKRLTGGGPIQPAEAIDGLLALDDALNRSDPFYRYSISLGDTDLTREEEWLVAAAQTSDGSRTVTVRVFARCAESVVERPVPMSVRIDPAGDTELLAKLRDFTKFGVGFTAPDGTVDVDMDLPGGLGGSLKSGSLTISPARRKGELVEFRLQVLDPQGATVAESRVRQVEFSEGTSKLGARTLLAEERDAFTMEIRFDLETQTTTCHFEASDPSGRRPEDVVAGFRVLKALCSPNLFRIVPLFGPPEGTAFPTVEVERNPWVTLARLVEVVDEIQAHTTTRLTVPDPAVVTMKELRDLEEVAELLRGEVVSKPWDSFTLHLHPGRATPEMDAMTAMVVNDLKVQVGDAEVALGYVQMVIPAARVRPGPPVLHDDHVDVVLEPMNEMPATLRHTTADPRPTQ
ncbi:hypothetical protein CAE01nite_28740 [Cellulomonas aerilata]|uniref:Restriction endonuclease type IV Mrr domain-containing protein n=2 Tax=Cellulomonas aerilata TaxID=515326 RepID=A0A512DF74_9CELL|nr:hypothetical protein CAE01nite_28740 [Cellulomonas aerilata]